MLDQSQGEAGRIEPLFYFKFQMRLEFIPFIEQEIQQFITFIERQIDKAEHVAQILVILNKRIRDIDKFYDENWSDYRAQQILRSRQQLVQFCKRNHAKISRRPQLIQEKVDGTPERQDKRTPIQQRQIKSESRQIKAIRQTPTNVKKQANNYEKVKPSTSKSIERQNNLKYPVSNKVSPYIAPPYAQSPSKPIKQQQSRDKDKQSPIRGIKIKDSPTERKVVPRKLTKQQYIQHLRNKKVNQ